MSMNPVGRQDRNTPQELLDEFFSKGGKVTYYPPGARSEEIEYTGGFYGKRKKKQKATRNKVIAHLVDVEPRTKVNPCGEIPLPVLMEPKTITKYRLQGFTVFDYTESLNMEPELVDKDQCHK